MQTFRPFGLLQYKVVRAINKSPSIVSSPHNFVLKKPERAKRLIVIKGQVRSSLYTLFHPHMYIYKTCHTMLPYSSDSKLLKMYGEYRKIRVR